MRIVGLHEHATGRGFDGPADAAIEGLQGRVAAREAASGGAQRVKVAAHDRRGGINGSKDTSGRVVGRLGIAVGLKVGDQRMQRQQLGKGCLGHRLVAVTGF